MKKTKTSKNGTRPIHRRIFLHPLSTLLLLCTGVLLVTASFQGLAVSYDITAKVAADLPANPAFITSHTDHQRVLASSFTITGTCPDQTYIRLYVNDLPTSTSQCDNNLLTLHVSLSPGANKLETKVYNTTNDEGPASPPITVYYDAPTISDQNPSIPTGTTGQRISGQSSHIPPMAPLTVTYDYKYKVLYPDALWKWDLTINGGVGPYRAMITWGDGSTATVRPSNSRSLSISHIFSAVGEYEPIVQVIDDQNNVAVAQLSVIVKSYPNAAASTSPTLLHDVENYLWIIWPSYAVILLMAVSFWLGEYQVIQRLAISTTRHHK